MKPNVNKSNGKPTDNKKVNEDSELSTGRLILFWLFYIPFTFLGGAAVGLLLSDSFEVLEGKSKMLGAAWIIACLSVYKTLRLFFAKCNWRNFGSFFTIFVGCLICCAIFETTEIICEDAYNLSCLFANIICIIGLLVVGGIIYGIIIVFGYFKNKIQEQSVKDEVSNESTSLDVQETNENEQNKLKSQDLANILDDKPKSCVHNYEVTTINKLVVQDASNVETHTEEQSTEDCHSKDAQDKGDSTNDMIPDCGTNKKTTISLYSTQK